MQKRSLYLFWKFAPLVTLTALSTAGCNFNLYQFFDAPSTDAQRLSKARACLDRGDYSCAATQYAAVTTLNTEVAAAEAAFSILREEGAGLAVITQAAAQTFTGGGTSAGGAFLTSLAGTLSRQGPGVRKRQALQRAYQKIASIPTSGGLRGLVRFLTGSALAAEVMAETIATAGTLNITDLVSDVASCSTVVCGTPPSGCDAPSANTLADGVALAASATPSLDTVATSDLSGSPTIGMIHGGIDAILFATNTGNGELGSSTGLASSVGGFAGLFSGAAGFVGAPVGSPCYRQLLVSNGIGN